MPRVHGDERARRAEPTHRSSATSLGLLGSRGWRRGGGGGLGQPLLGRIHLAPRGHGVEDGREPDGLFVSSRRHHGDTPTLTLTAPRVSASYRPRRLQIPTCPTPKPQLHFSIGFSYFSPAVRVSFLMYIRGLGFALTPRTQTQRNPGNGGGHLRRRGPRGWEEEEEARRWCGQGEGGEEAHNQAGGEERGEAGGEAGSNKRGDARLVSVVHVHVYTFLSSLTCT